MTVIRNGDSIDLPVILASLDDALFAEDTSTETVELLPGVSLLEMSGTLRDEFRIGQTVQGLIIAEVSNDSEYRGSLKAGMVIMAINRKKVETMGEAFEYLTEGTNLLYVYYEGRNNFLVIKKD